jgi:glycosyltransferase involved in cell wall biosynthesis
MAGGRTLSESGLSKIGVVGTYVPRRCGIATFSADLLGSMRAASPATEFWSVAMNDTPEGYDYPPEVHFEVGQKVLTDYRLAADFLNMNQVEAVCLQHEFGIYGGNSGSYVLRLMQNLRMPIVTTLHTVLEEPNRDQRDIVTALAQHSDRLVVMSRRARQTLRKVYGIAGDRIAVIPHGVPDMPFLDASFHKDQFGIVGRKVILTFGLLSRGKGTEYVIEALPEIVAAHPDAIFVVIGATHPEVRRQEGEAYRLSLQQRARELGVDDHVVFHNQFMDTRTLTEFLSTADVFVTPYLNREQIVSGVLSYALGAGKAAVSTPYWYAEEALSNGRGRVVPFRDAPAIAREIIDLLSDDVARNTIRKKAYTHARDMVWSKVADRYLKLLGEIREESGVRPRGQYRLRTLQANAFDLPQPSLDHLRVLTDDTGIFQHAKFAVPDRDHGYCTDDNARALVVALVGRQVLPDGDAVMPLAWRYLGFLSHAFNEDNGRFRNFMNYDRTWQESAGSEESHGRALWALGETVRTAPYEGMGGLAMSLFERALPAALEFTAPRASACALLGIAAYLDRFGGASDARRARLHLAEHLLDLFRKNGSGDWPWPEPVVTYANAVLPHVLIASGAALDRPEMVDTGLRSLRWLLEIQTDAKGHFIPVGNRGWLARNQAPARFDQQPIEVQHMVDALLTAYEVTGERHFMLEARRCFEWFLGRNDLQQAICDHATGGCRDGLAADGVNQNQGAESTLAWLHSLMKLHLAAGATAAAEPPPVTRLRQPPRLVATAGSDRPAGVPQVAAPQ